MRVIAEVGSTHLSKKNLIKEAVERAAEIDCDAVKFQLFPNEEKYTKSGNVWLSPELFIYAMEVGRENGIDVAASVFDEDSLDFLIGCDPKFIKFAYSQKENSVGIRKCIQQGIEAIVSCDVMTIDSVPERTTKLFCLPNAYPVYHDIRFQGLFPRFDGFSDHSLGYDLTLDAIRSGAKIIEKHVKVVDKGCPDCAFALDFKEFKEMVRAIRQNNPFESLEPRGL